MHTITYSDHKLRIDGVPALIQAGALHYFRLPHPAQWRAVLLRLRMIGFNAVVIPFPWAYHSPTRGLYDFTGPRDVRSLLHEVEQAGLWLIARVGPWVDTGLDAGGVPPWFLRLRGAVPDCASSVPPGPAFPFLREVWEWWEHLFPFVLSKPNLLFVETNPGPCANACDLARYEAPLREMVKKLGAHVPVIFRSLDSGDSSGDADATLHSGDQVDSVELLELLGGFPMTWGGENRNQLIQSLGTQHPRQVISQGIEDASMCYVLSPSHTGATWGYWGGPEVSTAYGIGAPIEEEGAVSASFFHARRAAMAIETLGTTLSVSARTDQVYASDPTYLRAVRTDGTTFVALLSAVGLKDGQPQLSIPSGNEILTTQPIHLPTGDVRMLPLELPLAGGILHMTTMEPVLQTKVAGRYLMILANEGSGSLLLSDDFRLRHARGPVRTQRLSTGLLITFEPARLSSLLLDAPEGPLQLLILEPRFAARVWPLDDNWRTSPFYPPSWAPDIDEPARGLVIGPDLVQPQKDGGFSYMTTQKGFGYRWGPWRGGDPHTWLAPIMWQAPSSFDPPDLIWESTSGAPEALPGFDDRNWQQIAVGAPMSMEAYGIDYGFVWYRGHFSGTAHQVTLSCRHACDLFLNGRHIAALNEPQATSPPTPKTIPLSPQLLEDNNVLVLLVENLGRSEMWGYSSLPHGLLSCALDNQVDIHWCVRGGLSGERSVQGFSGFADWTLVSKDSHSHITWHRATFPLSFPKDLAIPLFLSIEQTPTKAYIFLNGQMVGRYWEVWGAQRSFWLPNGLLRSQGENELLVAQWTRGAQPDLGVAYLEVGPVMAWHNRSASH